MFCAGRMGLTMLHCRHFCIANFLQPTIWRASHVTRGRNAQLHAHNRGSCALLPSCHFLILSAASSAIVCMRAPYMQQLRCTHCCKGYLPDPDAQASCFCCPLHALGATMCVHTCARQARCSTHVWHLAASPKHTHSSSTPAHQLRDCCCLRLNYGAIPARTRI